MFISNSSFDNSTNSINYFCIILNKIIIGPYVSGGVSYTPSYYTSGIAAGLDTYCPT